MATIYVDDGGDNSDGTTWAKAYTTLNTALTNWSTGDIILIRDDHTESGGTLTFTAKGSHSEPVPIYTANGSDVYTVATASTFDRTSNITFPALGYYIWHGVKFHSSGGLLLNQNNSFSSFTDCVFEWDAALGRIVPNATNSNSIYYKCTFQTTSAANKYYIETREGRCVWDGCTFSGTENASGLIRATSGDSGVYEFIGCDLSGISTVYDCSPAVAAGTYVVLRNCELENSATVIDTTPTSQSTGLEIIATDDAGALYRYEKHVIGGVITTNTSVYKTTGYQDADGSTNASHRIAPTSNLTEGQEVEGPMLTQYVSTGTKTITIYCADTFTTAANDVEAYAKIYYLNASGETLWSAIDTRPADLLAGSAHTTTSSLWTGTVTTEYKIEKSGVVINQAGWLGVKVCLRGKYEAGKYLYYDPEINIS